MHFQINKQLFRNFLFYAAGYIVPGILSFLFIPFIVRSFGSEIYAEYSMLFNCLSVVSMFCYTWVGHSYMRFHNTHSTEMYAVYDRYLKLSLYVGLLCFICLYLFVAKVNPLYLFITAPAFIFSVYYNFNLLKTQAMQLAKRASFAEIIRTIITISLPLLVSSIIYDHYELIILFAALLLAYATGYMYLSRRNESNIYKVEQKEDHNDVASLKMKIKNYGIPIAFFVSISLALTVNDRYLIAHILNYKSSGNYAAVYDVLYKGVNFACAPIVMTFFPHIVKQFNSGQTAEAYKSIKRALLLEVVIFIMGCIGLALFGRFFLEFLLKQSVDESVMKLAYILYAGVFIWQSAMLVHKPLELRLQTKYMAFTVFVVFAANITVNWFLLVKYKNVMVAAWTTLASSLLYLLIVISIVIFKKPKED